MFEARPMLTPPRMRQATKTGNVLAKAMPMEEATKLKADTTRMGLRPKRSLSQPETSAPPRQPSRAQLWAQPTGEMALAFTLVQNEASAATFMAVSLRWKKAS